MTKSYGNDPAAWGGNLNNHWDKGLNELLGIRNQSQVTLARKRRLFDNLVCRKAAVAGRKIKSVAKARDWKMDLIMAMNAQVLNGTRGDHV